jgi:GNAT superfamily N-acetyltransferase
MSSAARAPADSVATRVARRWRAIDPLLPAPGFTHGSAPGAESPHCGAELLVAEADALASAAARCEHWAGLPGSLDLSWGAARRFQLTALVADEDAGVAGGLDRLLSMWRDHLADVPEAGEDGTAAIVNWPSRDADGVAALLRHGFAPLEVLAARTTPRRAPARPRSVIPNERPLRLHGQARIRRAGPAETETVARLGLEIIRWDARFGTVNERPDTLDALRLEVAGLLAGPDPWTWLAERDGRAVGMLSAQRPPAAGWITPMTGPVPAAYLMLMFVEPGERGAGVGTALVDEFHREVGDAGVAVTLLHYELLNPLSAPFWNRHGYRPLWTTWQAVPARAIR